LLYLYIIIRHFGYFVNINIRNFRKYLIFSPKTTTNLFTKDPHLQRFNKSAIITDMKTMTGETLTEIANALGISIAATEKRLQTQKIKPITREALYPTGTIDRIRNVPGKGRPRKAK
jgi:hypothetical protein